MRQRPWIARQCLWIPQVDGGVCNDTGGHQVLLSIHLYVVDLERSVSAIELVLRAAASL